MQSMLKKCLRTFSVNRPQYSFVNIDDNNGQQNAVRYCFWQNDRLKTPGLPPLVLLGGTAQVINSWIGHVRFFGNSRPVLMYETRGQGQTCLDLANASMDAHVADFIRVCEALGISSKVDLCGFSFGGRLALAIAATYPERVGKLSLTGVAAGRNAIGRITFRAWIEALESGSLRSMLWNSMLHSYSRRFLTENEDRIPAWIESSVEANQRRCDGILAILKQTHPSGDTDPWHPINLAKRVRSQTQLICGELDQIAPADEVRRLATFNDCCWSTTVIADSAHMVPIEQPYKWRTLVNDFLN